MAVRHCHLVILRAAGDCRTAQSRDDQLELRWCSQGCRPHLTRSHPISARGTLEAQDATADRANTSTCRLKDSSASPSRNGLPAPTRAQQASISLAAWYAQIHTASTRCSALTCDNLVLYRALRLYRRSDLVQIPPQRLQLPHQLRRLDPGHLLRPRHAHYQQH